MYPKLTMPTGIEKRILCAKFYNRIKVFYEDPANQLKFEEWQARRKDENDLPPALLHEAKACDQTDL